MKTGERKKRDPAARRREILEAAARVFHRKGYEGASLDEVADLIGFSKAAIYYYFRSKDEILLEMAREGWRMLAELVELREEDQSQPMESFVTLIRNYLNLYARHLELFDVLFREASTIRNLAQQHGDREILSLQVAYRQQLSERMKKLLPPEEVDPTMKAIAGIIYAFMHIGGGPSEERVEQAVRMTRKLLRP